MSSFARVFSNGLNPRPDGVPMALPGIGPMGLSRLVRPRPASPARFFGDRFAPGINPRPDGVPPSMPATGPFGMPPVLHLRPRPRPLLAAPLVLDAPDALRRRALSLRHLQLDGIPVHEGLPCLPGRDEVRLRTHPVVMGRMVALLLLAGLAQRQFDRAQFDRLVNFFWVDHKFDEHERAFLNDPAPRRETLDAFCWGQEAVWTLLWAVGGVPSIGPATATCDIRRAVAVIMDQSVAMLHYTTKLRPIDEILGEADRTYRYHWAVHDAQMNGTPMPAGLVPEVVEQRRMALEWLIGRGGPSHHPGAGWIEVDLST